MIILVIVLTFHNIAVCASHFETEPFRLLHALSARYLEPATRDTSGGGRTTAPLSCRTLPINIVDDVIAVTCNQQLRELSHSAHIFIGMWKRR